MKVRAKVRRPPRAAFHSDFLIRTRLAPNLAPDLMRSARACDDAYPAQALAVSESFPAVWLSLPAFADYDDLMSNPQALLASARSAYRSALRASASTFSGDPVVRNGEHVLRMRVRPCAHHVVAAFRLKIRNEVLPYSPNVDPKLLEEKVTLVREIADVLRKNVVQARKVEAAAEPEAKERWGT